MAALWVALLPPALSVDDRAVAGLLVLGELAAQLREMALDVRALVEGLRRKG